MWLQDVLPAFLVGAATGGWWSRRRAVSRAVSSALSHAKAEAAAQAVAHGGSVVIGAGALDGRQLRTSEVVGGLVRRELSAQHSASDEYECPGYDDDDDDDGAGGAAGPFDVGYVYGRGDAAPVGRDRRGHLGAAGAFVVTGPDGRRVIVP